MFQRFIDEVEGFVLTFTIMMVSLVACSGAKPIPQDRSRVFGAAVLVSHATGVAIAQCLEQANEMMRRGRIDESTEWRKQCDTNAEGVWRAVSLAFQKQEDGMMAPCDVREAARFLRSMDQAHLPVVQDALAEAEWASLRCR